MSNQFQREDRYLVVKYTDMIDALTSVEREAMARLVEKIDGHRRAHGKPILQAVVVEHDWPEYEPVWKMIEARVAGAQPIPGMAVQALAGEIIEALLADEKDGGYDLTAGLFGAAFSKLVRRWAAAEWNNPSN